MLETKENTLQPGEIHPSAHLAMRYISALDVMEIAIIMESINSNALAGNRTASIAAETFRRVLEKEPVSDRYLMGLALLIMQIKDGEEL